MVILILIIYQMIFVFKMNKKIKLKFMINLINNYNK